LRRRMRVEVRGMCYSEVRSASLSLLPPHLETLLVEGLRNLDAIGIPLFLLHYLDYKVYGGSHDGNAIRSKSLTLCLSKPSTDFSPSLFCRRTLCIVICGIHWEASESACYPTLN
jgi:hypothetical protein